MNPLRRRAMIASAMSWVWPIRPTGRRAAIAAKVAGAASPATSCQIGVSTQPGDTTLTRIGASSTASAAASEASAPLSAASNDARGPGRYAAMPEVNTIEPPGSSSGAPCLASSSGPSNLESTADRGGVHVVLGDRLVGAADVGGGGDDVADLAGGSEEPLDVLFATDVHGNGSDAELATYGVELVDRAAGDRDLVALVHEFGGQGAAHAGAAADDDYMLLH